MKFIWFVATVIWLFLFVTCTNNVANNSTKTGNRSTLAMLYNPGGSPAVHAKIWFYPINYNPHTGGLAKKLAIMDSTTTNANGNYSIILDTGIYNVLAAGDSCRFATKTVDFTLVKAA